MLYNFKEYKPIFDTPMKRMQERAVSTTIMDLLNKNKYDNLEEFISKNGNYQDFLKKNSKNIVMQHFGKVLSEEDYIKILENLRVLTKSKQEFEQENIKTTNLDNKQFSYLKGKDKTYFVDTSSDKKTVEEQMKDLQPTQEKFQKADQRQNAENLFKELETRKSGLNLLLLNNINYDSLNNEEKLLFQIAQSYQRDIEGAIRVDLKKGIIVDESDNILSIQEANGEFIITKNENGVEKQQQPTKSPQKKLKANKNTIYSN